MDVGMDMGNDDHLYDLEPTSTQPAKKAEEDAEKARAAQEADDNTIITVVLDGHNNPWKITKLRLVRHCGFFRTKLASHTKEFKMREIRAREDRIGDFRWLMGSFGSCDGLPECYTKCPCVMSHFFGHGRDCHQIFASLVPLLQKYECNSYIPGLCNAIRRLVLEGCEECKTSPFTHEKDFYEKHYNPMKQAHGGIYPRILCPVFATSWSAIRVSPAMDRKVERDTSFALDLVKVYRDLERRNLERDVSGVLDAVKTSFKQLVLIEDTVNEWDRIRYH